MKTLLRSLLAAIVVAMLLPAGFASAQIRKTAAPAEISDADRKAIKELFKDVPADKYRLEFKNTKEVVGRKQVSMQDLQQVKKVTNPGEAAGYVVLIVENKSNSVVYILAVGSRNLETVLGREKTAKLNSIMTKYQR